MTTVTEYTAPEGFVPQLDELGKPVFWDGPHVKHPGHGYKIEVSWTPHEGMNYFVQCDEGGMGDDDVQALRKALDGLLSRYAAYSVSEDQWCDLLAFDTDEKTLSECVGHAGIVGVPVHTAVAVWQAAGRFVGMGQADD